MYCSCQGHWHSSIKHDADNADKDGWPWKGPDRALFLSASQLVWIPREVEWREAIPPLQQIHSQPKSGVTQIEIAMLFASEKWAGQAKSQKLAWWIGMYASSCSQDELLHALVVQVKTISAEIRGTAAGRPSWSSFRECKWQWGLVGS